MSAIWIHIDNNCEIYILFWIILIIKSISAIWKEKELKQDERYGI